jgi:hypothetical protein
MTVKILERRSEKMDEEQFSQEEKLEVNQEIEKILEVGQVDSEPLPDESDEGKEEV